MYIRWLLSLFLSFLLVVVFLPLFIKFLKKEKVKQTILHYVDMHAAKNGTPTMAGVVFILAIIISSIVFSYENNSLLIMSLVVTFAYGVIGFLDDYIKFKCKRNLGLRPYQKIISQTIIAVVVAYFVYKNQALCGSILNIPFSNIQINIAWVIIPFVIIVFLASTNSVNLTDGLDGLAGTTTLAYVFTFAILIILQLTNRPANIMVTSEYNNLITCCFACMGGLLGFLLFNCYPAKIFMGDCGSLALGGLIASISIFTQNSLYILIIGIMFVLSSLSVIIQVAYFKKTGKRVFLMSPLHHHFEKKGINEVTIVVWYSVITLMLGLICIIFELM